MSAPTHLRGLARPDLRVLAHRVARRGDGLAEHDLADVDADLRVRVHRLGELQRGRRELLRPLVAVGVELDVRQVRRQAFERGDGLERRADVAGHAEVAAVDVQRVRHAELAQRARQRVQHLARRDLPVHMVLVDVELALVELEGRDAARVDDLHAHRLAGVDRPRGVVADLREVARRRAALGEQLQEQLVVAEHHVGAVVEHRHVAHLHVRVARVARHHRRLEGRGVAHLDIAVAGGQRARRAAAARRELERVGRQRDRIGAVAVVFGHQQPRQVHLAAADVGVHVDAAGHHHAAAGIDLLVERFCRSGGCDDAAVTHCQVAPLPRVVMHRVDDQAAAQQQAAHAARLRASRATPKR